MKNMSLRADVEHAYGPNYYEVELWYMYFNNYHNSMHRIAITMALGFD